MDTWGQDWAALVRCRACNGLRGGRIADRSAGNHVSRPLRWHGAGRAEVIRSQLPWDAASGPVEAAFRQRPCRR